LLLYRLLEDSRSPIDVPKPERLLRLPQEAAREVRGEKDTIFAELRLGVSNLLKAVEERSLVREPLRRYGWDERNAFREVRKRRFAPSWWAEWLEAIAELQCPRLQVYPRSSFDEATTVAQRQLLAQGRKRLDEASGIGIAEEVRPAAWFWLAPSTEAARLLPGFYQELCQKTPSTPAEFEVEQGLRCHILKDMERTPLWLLAENCTLGTRCEVPARSAAAERLLIAYSRYRPTVGYCQGLNFIAAILIRLLDEASAFAVFCGLLERLPSDLYSCDPDRLATCRLKQQAQFILHYPRILDIEFRFGI
jgi:hypothetical protein